MPTLALLGVLSLGIWGAPVLARQAEFTPTWPGFQGGAAHEGAIPQSTLTPPLEVAWRFDDPEGESGLSAPVLVGDVAIGVGRAHVYGLDIATGQEEFSLDRAEGPIADPAIGDAGGTSVLVFTQGERDDTELTAVDLATREEIWTLPLESTSRSGVTVDGDRVYVGDRSGRLYAIDLATGDALWTYVDDGDFDVAPAARADKVFAIVLAQSDRNLRLVAVDSETGRASWDFEPGIGTVSASSPTIAEDRLFVGFGDLYVRALNPDDGQQLWSSRTRGFFSLLSSGAFADGDIFMADVSAGLYRLDAGTGARVWDYQFDSLVVRGSPIVVGSTAFLGLDDGRLAAVDLATGNLVWEGDTGSGALGAIAAGARELVVKKGGRRGGLVAFRADPDGELISVPSPTRLEVGPVLMSYGLAALTVFALLFLAYMLVLRRLVAAPVEPIPGGGPGDEEVGGGTDEATGRDATPDPGGVG
jgi:outer membrane protein assembly factor BamB